MTSHLANLHAALADARKAREEALRILRSPRSSNYYPSWTRDRATSAAESAARCEGHLLAVIESLEAVEG